MLIVRRAIAYLIDSFVVFLMSVAAAMLMVTVSSYRHFSDSVIDETSIQLIIKGTNYFLYQIICAMLTLLYFVYSETSEKKATLGKRVVKLKVVDSLGKKLSMRHGMLRFLAFYVPSTLVITIAYHYYPACIGWFPDKVACSNPAKVFIITYCVLLCPIFFTKDRRTLYDIITTTYVKDK